jgi:hypothetical protein
MSFFFLLKRILFFYLAQTSVQKYPIFFIKIECPNWSYYEINMYLGTFKDFKQFNDILALVKKFTTKFLTSSNLLITTAESEETIETTTRKKRRLLSAATSMTSAKKNNSNPYLIHSSHSTSSIVEGSVASTTMTRHQSPSVTQSDNNETSSKYMTWWDPNSKNTFYIDRMTGNS